MPEDDAQERESLPPARIAIVDDDHSVRSAMSSLVRSIGYASQSFDRASALLASDLKSFALVISDLQMPGMTGLDLLSALREELPTLPFILMTAYPAEHLKRRAFALGARAFLEKPCDVDVLIDLIELEIGRPDRRS